MMIDVRNFTSPIDPIYEAKQKHSILSNLSVFPIVSSTPMKDEDFDAKTISHNGRFSANDAGSSSNLTSSDQFVGTCVAFNHNSSSFDFREDRFSYESDLSLGSRPVCNGLKKDYGELSKPIVFNSNTTISVVDVDKSRSLQSFRRSIRGEKRCENGVLRKKADEEGSTNGGEWIISIASECCCFFSNERVVHS